MNRYFMRYLVVTMLCLLAASGVAANSYGTNGASGVFYVN